MSWDDKEEWRKQAQRRESSKRTKDVLRAIKTLLDQGKIAEAKSLIREILDED